MSHEGGSAAEAGVHGLVDHLFRRQAGRMVAALVRSLGPAQLDLAEEVVQEALIQALRRWPFHGVPENPGGWLYRVARNLALDHLRRRATFRGKETEIQETELRGSVAARAEPRETHLEGELTDDPLRLIFLCCHPRLPRDGRVALTLKTVAGFSVPEIARGFLAKEATVAQRLVRAQRRIRELRLPFEVPGREELGERLEAVLEVLYLMFNEGYAASDGDRLVRADLCAEALRLAGELAANPVTDRPEVHALAALLAFQGSRLAARVDEAGRLVPLAEQDRGLWDRRLIHRGFAHLDRAARGDQLTPYHLQAAIASHHAAAPSAEATDWSAVLDLYDQLLARQPSPVVALNRAVALARVVGPEAGLRAVAEIADDPRVTGYHLLHAIRGELLRRAGEEEGAVEHYRRALECPCSTPERRFLEAKLLNAPAPDAAG